jgi:hypothetical protein
MEAQQNKFDGWAVIELFGHQKIAGHVTTEYFGSAAMFRVDVPELPEREVTIERPEYVDTEQYSGYAYAGSVLRREQEPGFTRIIGPGAVYAINPCDEPTVRKARELERQRPIVPVSLVTDRLKAIAACAVEDDSDRPDYPEDKDPDDLY